MFLSLVNRRLARERKVGDGGRARRAADEKAPLGDVDRHDHFFFRMAEGLHVPIGTEIRQAVFLFPDRFGHIPPKFVALPTDNPLTSVRLAVLPTPHGTRQAAPLRYSAAKKFQATSASFFTESFLPETM